MNRRGGFVSSVTLLALFGAMRAMPHDPPPGDCGSFSRDVAHELAVMRSPAIALNADASTTRWPGLVLDKHYAISLIAQTQLRFPAKPGRASRGEAPRGGVFRFEAPASGRYRVSITSRHWIDVLDGELVVPSVDHHGPGRNLVHKIVEFELAAGRPLTLQLSGQNDAIVGLAITAVAAS